LSKLSEMAAPKSDQLNATDLVAGPIDITVTRYTVSAGEQPLSLHAANIEGRPWKPCKTMMRWMSQAWKTDEPADIVGKTIRLYCDPEVFFGGMKTGGIRISHLSHIDGDIALQEGNRRQTKSLKIKVVKPIPKAADVVPLKVVEAPQETQADAFDVLAFASEVANYLSTAIDADELAAWWKEQEPTRKKAGAADRNAAIEIANTVKTKIAALRGEGEV